MTTTMTFAKTLACSLLVAFVAVRPAVGGSTPDDLERSLAMLDRLDTTMVSVDYVEQPLLRIIDELSMVLPFPIAADWDALGRIGVGMRDELDLRMRDVTGLTVLNAIAVQLGDQYDKPQFEVHAGRIVLTSVEGTAPMRVTSAYDVRDMLARGVDAELKERLRERESSIMPGENDAEPGDDEIVGDGEAEDAGDVAASPALALMYLISEHVDPDAWIDVGGSQAKMTEHEGAILLTAPASMHRGFRDALRRLRAANPSALAVRAMLVDLPRPEWERLLRRRGVGHPLLGQAVATSENGSVRWDSTGTVRLGASLTTQAKSSEMAIDLELLPTYDEAAGLVSIELAITTEQGDDRRSVATTVTLLGMTGGAVVELPAAQRTETVRVLVILPERA